MITIKTEAEIEIMAEAGKRLARILEILKKEVRVGMETRELDARAFELIKEADCKPAFLGYAPHGAGKPFPATICVSVNDCVVHGVPGSYVIDDGDLVGIDAGLIYKKFYADAATTVIAGEGSKEAKKLVHATEEALHAGIRAAKAGNTLGDIGHAVSEVIHENGFSIVRALTGHGIGRELHEDPYVFNFGRKGEGEKLVPGMVIAIEPMVAAGNANVKQLKDDSFVTADGSLSAHFEHTVAITEKGPIILTKN